MSDMLCWLTGALVTISVYLMLSSQLMRWLFGVVILSSTINLVILVAGRVANSIPPFVTDPPSSYINLANPLPQAFILTAIVIGFGLLAFSLVLVRKIWVKFKTNDVDLISYSERKMIEVEENE